MQKTIVVPDSKHLLPVIKCILRDKGVILRVVPKKIYYEFPETDLKIILVNITDIPSIMSNNLADAAIVTDDVLI